MIFIYRFNDKFLVAKSLLELPHHKLNIIVQMACLHFDSFVHAI